MENHLEDKLLEAKLCFFIVLANEVEPFLRKFQTDKPVSLFVYRIKQYSYKCNE